MRNVRYTASVLHTMAGQSGPERVSVASEDPEVILAAVRDRIADRWVQPDLAQIQTITRVRDGKVIWSRTTPLQRIVADNDPRNGPIVDRLIRMIEHPERKPDADGLYHDELAPERGES